jgi:hypothetical protein
MAKPEQRLLPVSGLIVDPNVQRPLDRSRVAKIADDLDLSAIGVVTVSHRGNGSYHVIDGQHRVEALRLAGGDGEKVLCRIFDGLTVEEEARLFRLLNNTVRLQALDKFRVRTVEGEAVATAITQILAKHGWKINPALGDGSFSAVVAAERIYNRDPQAFERTLITVTRAWGHDTSGVDGRIFEGIGLVYARYGSAVDDSQLADRLARRGGGPNRLLGDARGFRDMYRLSVVVGVADIVVELYNARRKTQALAPWRS